MRIAFCSSEMASLAKVGGLADVTESLPKALAGLGEDVWVFLPLYKQIWEGHSSELEDTG
ncbi:MAG TPA: starch synthase, partial [Thermosulfidibacter takaii]|nr:starch synthase [Thermosulfidibacter takaii]